MWFFREFAEIRELLIWLAWDSVIIKISYWEIPQNFGLPILNFWIFWFKKFRKSNCGHLKKYALYHKTDRKILLSFYGIITYLRKKVTHCKKYVSREKFIFLQLIVNFANFWWNNTISISANKIIVIIK